MGKNMRKNAVHIFSWFLLSFLESYWVGSSCITRGIEVRVLLDRSLSLTRVALFRNLASSLNASSRSNPQSLRFRFLASRCALLWRATG